MQKEIYLKKMPAQLKDNQVNYYLDLEDDLLKLNDCIGQQISLKSLDEFKCSCGQISKTAFRSGFCKRCFFESPLAGESIFRPELSTAHLDQEDRDLEWEKKNQLQPHIVYLAFTDKVKVGVTRKNQVPTRWIDQGAVRAVALIEVANRYLAGVVEVKLKDHFSDKTAYQSMLKYQEAEPEDLLAHADKALEMITQLGIEYTALPYLREVFNLTFPMKQIPQKIKSVKMVEDNKIDGILTAIKGQYLVVDNQYVVNIRSNAGQKVQIEL